MWTKCFSVEETFFAVGILLLHVPSSAVMEPTLPNTVTEVTPPLCQSASFGQQNNAQKKHSSFVELRLSCFIVIGSVVLEPWRVID